MAAKAPSVQIELSHTLERVAQRFDEKRAQVLASHADLVHWALSAAAEPFMANPDAPDPGHLEHIQVVSVLLPSSPGSPPLTIALNPLAPPSDGLTLQLSALPVALTPREVEVLARHPPDLQSALKAAAASLIQKTQPDTEFAPALSVTEVVGDPHVRLVPAAEARRRMQERAGTAVLEELLSSDEIAMRLGLKTRQSVHDWMRKGRLLGWQGAKRGYVFPAGQLDDRNRPLDGLQHIGQLFGDAYAAWAWMTTPKTALDGETPHALLVRGDLDRAVEIAEGDLQGDFA